MYVWSVGGSIEVFGCYVDMIVRLSRDVIGSEEYKDSDCSVSTHLSIN